MGARQDMSPGDLEHGLVIEKTESLTSHISSEPPSPTTTKSSLGSQRWLLDKQQTSVEEDKYALCTLVIEPEFKDSRDELMAKVEIAYNEYGLFYPILSTNHLLTFPADLLQKAQAMVAMGRPTSSEYRSVE